MGQAQHGALLQQATWLCLLNRPGFSLACRSLAQQQGADGLPATASVDRGVGGKEDCSMRSRLPCVGVGASNMPTRKSLHRPPRSSRSGTCRACTRVC